VHTGDEEDEETGGELTPFTAVHGHAASTSAAVTQEDMAETDEMESREVCPGLPRVGGKAAAMLGANRDFQALPQFDDDLDMDDTSVVEMVEITSLQELESPEVEVAGTTSNPQHIERRINKVEEETQKIEQWFLASEGHARELGGETLAERMQKTKQNCTLASLADWAEKQVPLMWSAQTGDDQAQEDLIIWEVEFAAAVLILKKEGYPINTQTSIAYGEILLRAM